jgi:hypothetical protein
MNPLFITVSAYLLIFFMTILMANTLTKGFLLMYLRVKFNSQKMLILRVHDDGDPYFAVAKFQDGRWRYKQKGSKNYSCIVLDGKSKFQKLLGVNYLETRAIDGAIFEPFGPIHSGLDPERTDNLMVRIAMLSKLKNTQLLIIMILVVVAIAIAGFAAYKITSVEKIVLAIQAAQAIAEGVVPVQ